MRLEFFSRNIEWCNSRWLTAILGLLLVCFDQRVFGEGQGQISGIVVDEGGKPVVGALVGILDQSVAGLREAQTDKEGRFRVSDLSMGLYRVVVTKYRYRQAFLDDVKPSPAELMIRLVKNQEPASVSSDIFSDPDSENEDMPKPETPFTLSVDVQEVLLNISVEDRSGRQVIDLAKENFTVLQDGVPQEIRYFGQENVPFSAVLLIDTSSSMQGSPMVEAKVAALAFLEQCRPQDSVSLVEFNDKVRVVRPFTQDRLLVRTGIHSLTPRGGTALYDALIKSIELLERAPHPRHVIILLSDGKDEDSFHRFGDVERQIQTSDVVVFSIGEYAELDRKLFMNGKKYYKLPEYEVNLNPVWVLGYLADLSGGRTFFPRLGEPLEPLFSEIARELHQQYVVTYQPRSMEDLGGFHSIDVRVDSPGHSGPLKVRTRRGFLSKAPAVVSAGSAALQPSNRTP